MTFRKFLCGFLLILLALSMFFAGWFLAQTINAEAIIANITAQATTEATEEATTEAAEETTTEATEPEKKPDSISVAIYPYVSNMQLFQKLLTEMWAEMEPEIALEFIDWNCYSDPYPNNIDVITYDALFMEHLIDSQYIQPLDIELVDSLDDVIPFAMEGARYNDNLYGLPFLVCSSFLIHRADDEAMGQVQNFAELCKELEARKKKDPTDGLQVGYADEVPFFYLDALIDYTETYTTFEEGPNMTPPDENVMKRLLEIKALMAETLEGEDFRASFAQNQGSACYAYSEALYDMGDMVDELTIRPISFFEGENIQMFYADLASLCSHVTDPVEKKYCMKLINLIASEEFLSQLSFASGEVQYMLPAREQVYLNAMEKYPIYKVLHQLATNENNKIFRFGTQIFDYKNLASVALR